MRAFIRLSMSATLLILASVWAPAFAGSGEAGYPGDRFRICNRTSWVVTIAIAWWGAGRSPDSPGGLNTMGWFTYNPVNAVASS